MNKQLIAHRFTKAADTYTRAAVVQQQIATKMTALLRQHLPARPLNQVVEFGCGTGIYSRLLLQSLQPKQLLLNDICAEMEHACRDLLSPVVSFVGGDAERLPLPQESELITSCSTLQWFEEPDLFFQRCNQALATDGHLAFTTFGPKNMHEIRQLTQSGLDYRSLSELERALAPHYEIVHATEELLPLHFDTPMQVLYHLKQTGVTGTGGAGWTRDRLAHFCAQYATQFTEKSRVKLTYHPLYIIAKKK